MAGLCALGNLNFNELDLGVLGLLFKSLRVKAAIGRAAAKIARGNLPDQVTTMLTVVLRHTSLARIVGEAPLGCAFIQSLNGIG